MVNKWRKSFLITDYNNVFKRIAQVVRDIFATDGIVSQQGMGLSLIRQKISEDTDEEITFRIYNVIKLGSEWKVYKSVHCLSFRPLRKMATGMIFAALAFGAATLVEVNVVVRMSSNHKSCTRYKNKKTFTKNLTYVLTYTYRIICMHAQPARKHENTCT